MSMADSLPWKRGGSLTHLLGPHTALLCQSGVLWEHTGEQSNSTFTQKIEDAAKAELADVFQVSRTAIPALPFPHQLFGVCILIPREQSYLSFYLCSTTGSIWPLHAVLLFSSSPAHLVFKFITLFPPVFVSNCEKWHPSQPEGTHLSAPQGLMFAPLKQKCEAKQTVKQVAVD